MVFGEGCLNFKENYSIFMLDGFGLDNSFVGNIDLCGGDI